MSMKSHYVSECLQGYIALLAVILEVEGRGFEINANSD